MQLPYLDSGKGVFFLETETHLQVEHKIIVMTGSKPAVIDVSTDLDSYILSHKGKAQGQEEQYGAESLHFSMLEK